MTQKWLIAPVDSSFDANVAICQAEGCVGFYSGIPPFLQAQAEQEQWVLPHFWTEVIDTSGTDVQGG
jgi:hypothetical protein